MDVTDATISNTLHCSKIRQVLAHVGDKWSVLVIMMLRERSRRFNELRRDIDGISQRMLTLTLRHLERDGLIIRTVTPTIPPRVDYELTPLGHSLAVPVHALGKWAMEHLGEIDVAQAHFDGRQSGGAT
jgi:DNA-binding HxlR family transcriptional regulator